MSNDIGGNAVGGPLISMVITTKNEENTIRNCVMSLLEQTYLNFEIVVVDARSTDHTLEILQELKPQSHRFSNCKKYQVTTCEATTPSMGRNIGVKQSQGEIVIFTDGDCVADKNWISALLQNLNGRVGMVGGPNLIKHFKNSRASDTVDRVLGTFVGSGGSAQFNRIQKVTRINGSLPACNMALRKDLFERLGGFDESLRYNEDTILCQRVHDNGLDIVYVPSAKVWHFIGLDCLTHYIKFICKYGLERGKNIPNHPRLMSKYYALSVFSFLMLCCLALSSVFFPAIRLPSSVMFLIAFSIVFANSFQIGISNRSIFSGFMSIPILILIYVVYNSSLLYGIALTIIRKQTKREDSK